VIYFLTRDVSYSNCEETFEGQLVALINFMCKPRANTAGVYCYNEEFCRDVSHNVFVLLKSYFKSFLNFGNVLQRIQALLIERKSKDVRRNRPAVEVV
jgi:hypothetical protein